MHTKRLAAAAFAIVVALAACSGPGTSDQPGGSGNESQAPAADQVLRRSVASRRRWIPTGRQTAHQLPS